MPANKSPAILFFLLLLGACSSADRDAPAEPAETEADASSTTEAQVQPPAMTPGVNVTALGAEPRLELGIVELGTTTIPVSATSSTDGTVGEEAVSDRVGASYKLDVSLRTAEIPSQLISQMSVSDVETTGFATRRAPALWEWRLGTDGVLSTVTMPVQTRGSRLGELLGAQGLFLMVPGEAVGAGATWTYVGSSRDAPVEVTITGISNDDIEATITSRIETADATIETSASGRWGKTNLLAQDVTSQVEVSFESTTSRDGVEVPVVVTKRVEFNYGEGQ